MKHSQTNGQTNTVKENNMPSPRPGSLFAPLKRKIINKDIKASGGNAKVVASTPDIHRKSLNAMEQTRVNITKSGALARETAKPIEAKNAKGITPKGTVSIRSGSGISGKSGSNVGKVFKPMGGGGLGGLLGSIKNR